MITEILHIVATTLLIGNFYTSPTCPSCAVAKNVLIQNCIKFKEISIGPGNKYGINEVPVFDIRGKRYVGSYEIEKFARANNQCNQQSQVEEFIYLS